MTVTDLYQLISPASFLAMAIVLLFLARSRPEMRSALWFSGTYALAACGFSLTFIQGYFSDGVFVTIATSIYFGATILLSIGLVKRAAARLPRFYFGAIIIGGGALLSYYQLINPQLEPAQISTGVISAGLVLSACFVAARQSLTRRSKIVILLHALFGLSFLTPSIIMLSFGGLANVLATPQLLTLFRFDRLISDALALSCGAVVTIAYVIDLLNLTRHDANTDPLTGLLNRRAFGDAAAELNETIKTDTGSLFMIMADLDHFKQVNDEYGHLAGDALITKTAHILRANSLPSSVIARLGGEEFIIAFKAESLANAVAHANRLRKAVQAIKLDTKAGAKSFTISLGITQHMLPETLLETRDRADQALYLAKAQGRNQVATHEDLAIFELRRHLEANKPFSTSIRDRAKASRKVLR